MSTDKRNIIICIGVTAVVYLIFKYIMPLAAPFIIAFLLAAGMNGQVRLLNRRLRLKRGIAAVVLMIFWGGMIAAVLWLLGGLLVAQIKKVIDNYDVYYAYINDGMCSFCGGVDGFMGFAGGTTLAYIDSGIIGLMESARDKIMPSIMGGSIGAFKGFITFSGVFVIFFMALYFFMKDYDRMLEAAGTSQYAEEFDFFYTRTGKIIYTFIKTQLIIMTITMVICGVGLLWLRNPYWLLLGIVLGLVDALPVLLAMCFISYVVREYLEPKLMGKGLGTHPLGMLAAVYEGLVLFGVAGVITGPLAFILIRELVTFINRKQGNSTRSSNG